MFYLYYIPDIDVCLYVLSINHRYKQPAIESIIAFIEDNTEIKDLIKGYLK